MGHDWKPYTILYLFGRSMQSYQCARCGRRFNSRNPLEFAWAAICDPSLFADTDASKGEALDFSDDSTRARAELVAGLTDDKA